MRRHPLVLALILLTVGCAAPPGGDPGSSSGDAPQLGADRHLRPAGPPRSEVVESLRLDVDDLVGAGLGLDGMRSRPPTPVDPAAPTTDELRRLAIWSNFSGLADLSPTGGFEALPVVAGSEYHALLRLPERRQPFRVMVQVPEEFDTSAPCLLVVPVSGSRGVYGAVPVEAGRGLARGCAVVTTDKGAGTDYFDHASATGVRLDGTRAMAGDVPLAFRPAPARSPLVSVPHAHSGDHPEADWGRHAIEAARYALAQLGARYPEAPPFDPARTRIVAVGLSNGGSAALRAIEIDAAEGTGLFDAAVVAAPNVTPPAARPLYDYATEAALLQPCLLADPEALVAMPFASPALVAPAEARCASLHEAGIIDAATPQAARERLLDGGFDATALGQAAVNTTLDVWRSVAAMYASAYLRAPVDAMPCRYAVAAVEDGEPTLAGPEVRSTWWARGSGVVPGAGLGWIDAMAETDADDPHFPGLACLRGLWTGDDATAHRLREAVEGTRASAEIGDIPVLVIHGRQDGLIPLGFSARPWVEQARANGASRIAFWEVDGAQHFDVLVPYPGFAGSYVPLLPIVHEALDAALAVLDGAAMPGDRVIRAVDPR